MSDVYIALGANLGEPAQQIKQALLFLSQSVHLNVVNVSSLYHSKPMGPQDQPDYVNAVCQVECHDLTAEQLLAFLHQVEDEFGRQRIRHWGERTLDLDLLLFDDIRSDTEALKLPHPGLYDRGFVLQPLAEFAPHLELPNNHSVLQQLAMLTDEPLTVLCSRSELMTLLSKG
jgi:2-amino-4-hydroxy-6-hydroxymethyldihydropteridine diphosphokinase